jgi:long-subunit acyl-CoA synthetase (AMP-forming)
MVGFELFSFSDLINEGMKAFDVTKQEPLFDSIMILGTTSGTTGEPK